MQKKLEENILTIEEIVKKKLTKAEIAYVTRWEQQAPLDVIIHIIKYCAQVRNVVSFRYIDVVIRDVQEKEVTTLKQAQSKYPLNEAGELKEDEVSTISIRLTCRDEQEKISALKRLQEVFVLLKVNSVVKDKEYTYIEAQIK